MQFKLPKKLKTEKTLRPQLNAFIIDDSTVHAELLYNDLHTLPEMGDLHIYHSCSEAALPLLELQPDVLFLDIEMPGCSGFDFFESFQSRINFPVKVVFYSAFHQYVLEALRHAAFDFLLKPYKQDELKAVVKRLVEAEDRLSAGEQAPVPPAQRKIALQTVSQLMLLTIGEILHLQYSRTQRAWLITLTNRTTHRLHQSTTADDLLALHPSLARVSQGNIVNLTYLTAIENNTQRCLFCPPFDDVEVYASRRNFAKLKEKFSFI